MKSRFEGGLLGLIGVNILSWAITFLHLDWQRLGHFV